MKLSHLNLRQLIISVITIGIILFGSSSTQGQHHAAITPPQLHSNSNVCIIDSNLSCLLPLKEIWSQRLQKGQVYGATSAVGGYNMVFIGSSKGIMYALNHENGTLQWEFTADAAIYNQACFVEQKEWDGTTTGRLYFTDHNGSLYCVNPRNGTLIWKNKTHNILSVSAPVYYDGMIYFVAEQTPLGHTSVLKGVHHSGGKQMEVQLEHFQANTNSPPLIQSNNIIVSDILSNTINIFDLEGNLFVKMKDVAEAPQDFQGIVDFGTHTAQFITADQTDSSKVYAFNYHNGEPLWSTDLNSTVIGLAEGRDGGNILIAQTLDSIHLINKQNGTLIWSIQEKQDLNCLSHKLPQPSIWGSYVIVNIERINGATIKAYNIKTGIEVLCYEVPSNQKTIPFQNFAIIGTTLFYTDRDYVVHAFALNP